MDQMPWAVMSAFCKFSLSGDGITTPVATGNTIVSQHLLNVE